MDKPPIGFIGLGRMGGPMARNLAGAGYPVHVFDVDTAACRRAAAQTGISAHGAPAEVAAQVTVLWSALPNDEIVKQTYLGERGVLAGGRAGLITSWRAGRRVLYQRTPLATSIIAASTDRSSTRRTSLA